MLNSKPDIGPLLSATDCYGNPTPFVRYCKLPKERESRSTGLKSKQGRTTGTGIATRARRARKRLEETRVEETRVEEKEEKEEREKTKPLRVSEKKKRERKPLRVSGEKRRKRKERISTTTQQKEEAQQTEALEPEKPENPTESEAGSAERHILPKPTRSAFRRGNPQRIGDVIDEWLPEHWQDPDCESFGWEIVRALGYSDDRHNLKARSEWGAFASWWSKVKKAAPVIVLDELRAKAIYKAEYLRTKGKSAKNRSAVWFHIMYGELSKQGVTMTQPARASPSR